MTLSTHRFRVGDMECVAVKDGTFVYATGTFFSNVPQEQIENSLRASGVPTEQVETPYICLLVKTGSRKVLVDTGAGGIVPTTGDLLKNLSAEGISAAEITDVVLTHGHPDHIGGVLDASGNPAFPNARYVMSKVEWDFWNDPSALHDSAMDAHMKQMLVGSAQKNLPPLKGRIELFLGEKEIVPGVRAVPAAGHTPGQVAVWIASAKAQLLFSTDAVLHPLHLENPGWRSVLDLDEEDAANTRQGLFERAAADGATVLAYHFPFPGLGRVRRAGGAFRWESECN